MELRLSIELAGALTRAFAQAPEIVLQELETATGSALAYLQSETAERTPTDLGTLRGAFVPAVYVSPGLDAVFSELANPLPYALPVEMGTRPHYPPLEPLVGWVERKLQLFGDEAESAARAIQHKIGLVGSPGAGMAHFALLDGRSTVEQEYRDALTRAMGRIAAAGESA